MSGWFDSQDTHPINCTQGKVVQLQRNVGEWKESYDQLMGEFRKLSLEKVVEREELVKEVRILSSNAKVSSIEFPSQACFRVY